MNIPDKDFKIKVTKGTGPGGQHKNKTESCVTITHIPTGLKEKCQETRSKIRNIEIAKQRLIQRLEKLKEAIISVQEDFDKILVITHVEELRDAFPTRIDVIKTAEGSTIEVN